MKDIIKSYNELKTMEDVDLALIESYIADVLKGTGCKTIEELKKKIDEKKEKINKFAIRIKENNQNISDIKSQKEILYINKENERRNMNKKGTKLILVNIIVIGLACSILVSFFSISSLLLAIIMLIIDTNLSFKLFNNLSVDFYKIQENIDELSKQEVILHTDADDYLLESISLYNSTKDLESIRDNIVDFFELYISAKSSSQVLNSEENLEETKDPKSLHRI